MTTLAIGDPLPTARLPFVEQQRILTEMTYRASLRSGKPMAAITVADLLEREA